MQQRLDAVANATTTLLPNATATLYRNLRRLLRLIGDHPENAFRASTDMVPIERRGVNELRPEGE